MKKHFRSFLVTLLVIMLSLTFSSKSLSQVPQPCNPDCFNTPFPIPGYYISINMAPLNCELHIWYTFRIACGIWYDVQILKIETVGSDCFVYQPFDKLFKTAYYQLIKANPMGFLPVSCSDSTPGTYCNEQWRISQAACWATYDIVVVGQTHTVTYPCIGTGCCLQRMRICRICSGDIIQIDPLGDPYPSVDCSATQPPPEAPPGTYCNPVCNWYLYKDGGIIKPNTGDNNLEQLNSNKASTVQTIKDNNLPIVINSKNTGKFIVRITDSYGNNYFEQEGKLEIGKNEVNIKLHDLKSGYYIYNIFIDGNLMTTDKIYLIK
jgi:hypothetical protein